jgi:hypothetical protein
VSESRNSKDSADAGRSAGLRGGLGDSAPKILAGIASQTVILTAVLFYFGWARARATYSYFGVDVSVLNFSVSDYVLRSVNAAFPLLIAIGLLAVASILVHDQLRPRLAADTAAARRLVRILSVVGWVLAGIGFILALVITGAGGSAPPGPAIMLVGFAAIVCALFLRIRYVTQSGSQVIGVMAVLLILAFFWTVTAYADYVGVQAARQLQAGLPTAANVTVYSSRSLSFTGPGVTESTELPDSMYQFRYSGLRLLVSSGGQYFLLPVGWRQGAGSVLVLPARPWGLATRVQFEAHAP